MNRQTLTSSSIKSAGYDEQRQELEIEFLNGDLYRYLNVPLEIYVHFLDADSHGKFYVKHIRNNYDFNKIDDNTKSSTTARS